MKNAIYVIDPGMMEAGGHHAALLQTLIEEQDSTNVLTVVSHNELNDILERDANQAGISTKRHFSTNFYQHYEDSIHLNYSGMQSYIRLLAMEYMSILKEVSKVSQNTKTVCFYPCLNWEHASALSLALSFIPTLLGKVTHKVCCMFKPIEKSLLSDFYYRSAFRNLSRITNVHLFASDWETRQYYSELHIPIKGIHPCYLMPWRQLRLRNSQHPSHRHFLLYMGDAKENKGFTILPSLIRRLVDQFGTNLKLTVQYTLTWESPELQNSIEELQTLARQFEQLNVVNKFWDIRDIVDCIGSVDMFLCTYDVGAYQDKSSGLAWLAAFFNIPVMMLNTCWLTREFERLGVRYGISNILLPKEIPITVPANSDYASSLYADLQSWFVE